MMTRDDYETPPTVVGKIVAAWIGRDGEPDVMHVEGVTGARDSGTLLQVIGDPANPDPHRPFCLIGFSGTIARHGYTDEARLIGKHCMIYSDGRLEQVAIEPEEGDRWDLIIWDEFS